MRCPFCRYHDSRVVDSRETQEGESIRRRRECLQCHRRFTTYEKVEQTPTLMVIKKDGRREPFDRQKLIVGLLKACQKRPISLQTVEGLASKVEEVVKELGTPEVSSRTIGEAVIEQLRNLDEVAYVRFASVYKEFKDASHFAKEVASLTGEEMSGETTANHT